MSTLYINPHEIQDVITMTKQRYFTHTNWI